MADIFSGTEVPRWLQEATHQSPGELGQILGTALGAGLVALEPDTEAEPNEDGTQPRKGFKKGLFEARQNIADPNWRVKTKALEGQVIANWARAATSWQQLDATNRDMAIWTTTDLPAISKFQEELKTNPDAVPPVVQSGKGQQVLQQIETSRLRKATLDFKRDQAANMLDIQQQRVDNASTAAKQEQEDLKYFNKILPTVKSLADRARIRALQRSGKADEAFAALEAAEKEEPVAVQAAEARGQELRKTEAQKAQEKLDYEKTREANREALAGVNQKYKIDLEKLKLSDKGTTGKVVTEDEYVNRHLTSVFNAMYKESSNPKQALADADRALRARYQIDHTQSPKPKAATTQSTDKDPLGILGQ